MMIKTKFLLCVCISMLQFVVLPTVGVAQQENSTQQQLIISIPSLSDKNKDEIVAKFQSIDGVKLEAVCPQLKCFVMYYDSKKLQPEQIAREIESLNPKYKTEIKQGTTIEQIIDKCTKYTTKNKP